MTNVKNISIIYDESTNYYEFLIKLGLYGYEINNSFKENDLVQIFCYKITVAKYSVMEPESLKKILNFISEYINEKSGPFYYNVIPIATKICDLILTYPDKSIITPCFKLMCEKIPDIMKKSYEEQKQFLKYKIN